MFFSFFSNKIESSSKKVLEILTCILSNSPSALEVCLLGGRCFQGNGVEKGTVMPKRGMN